MRLRSAPECHAPAPAKTGRTCAHTHPHTSQCIDCAILCLFNSSHSSHRGGYVGGGLVALRGGVVGQKALYVKHIILHTKCTPNPSEMKSSVCSTRARCSRIIYVWFSIRRAHTHTHTDYVLCGENRSINTESTDANTHTHTDTLVQPMQQRAADANVEMGKLDTNVVQSKVFAQSGLSTETSVCVSVRMCECQCVSLAGRDRRRSVGCCAWRGGFKVFMATASPHQRAHTRSRRGLSVWLRPDTGHTHT